MPTATESQTPQAEPAAAPRRVRRHILFRILSGGMWALTLLLAAEFACRFGRAVLEDWANARMMEAAQAAMDRDDAAYEAWLPRASAPSFVPHESPGLHVSPWLPDGTLDPDRPAASEALLFEAAADGAVTNLRYPDMPEEIRALGGALAAAPRLQTLLREDQLRDLLGGQTGMGRRTAEYMIAAGDGPLRCCETTLYEHPSDSARRAVLIRRSRYAECMRSYRPHVYRRNWYSDDFKRSEFWTNALGWRDREIVLPKPPGVFRIVLIGGSTAVEGPHNDLTCAKYLERMFAEARGEGRVEVVNAGVDALAVSGAAACMDRYLALEPDLLLHYNFVNEAAMVIEWATRDAFPPDTPATRARRFLAKSSLLRAAVPGLFHPGDAPLAAQTDRFVLESLGNMADRCAASGVRFVVSTFARPDPAHLSLLHRVWLDNQFLFQGLVRVSYLQYAALTDLHNEMLEDWAARRGLVCVPVAGELGGDPALFTDTCHMRLDGIQRKAEVFFAHLSPLVPE